VLGLCSVRHAHLQAWLLDFALPAVLLLLLLLFFLLPGPALLSAWTWCLAGAASQPGKAP
jgi:hypothetical protein